jgi:hypothetical protein
MFCRWVFYNYFVSYNVLIRGAHVVLSLCRKQCGGFTNIISKVRLFRDFEILGGVRLLSLKICTMSILQLLHLQSWPQTVFIDDVFLINIISYHSSWPVSQIAERE